MAHLVKAYNSLTSYTTTMVWEQILHTGTESNGLPVCSNHNITCQNIHCGTFLIACTTVVALASLCSAHSSIMMTGTQTGILCCSSCCWPCNAMFFFQAACHAFTGFMASVFNMLAICIHSALWQLKKPFVGLSELAVCAGRTSPGYGSGILNGSWQHIGYPAY